MTGCPPTTGKIGFSSRAYYPGGVVRFAMNRNVDQSVDFG